MSDLTFAQKDPAIVLAEALAIYKAQTVSAEAPSGVTLAPADPRRLHLQALLYLIAQLRSLIDFSGKQNLLRYVGDEFIDELADLYHEPRLQPGPSTTTLRFVASVAGVLTIAAGKRATDGINLWRVTTTTTSAPNATYVDAVAECTVNGSATDGISIGQIDTLADSIPNIESVSNTTETTGGRDLETLEEFRARLRTAPDKHATCGPRSGYEAIARAASSSVEDVVALGPEDGGSMSGAPPAPGELFLLVMEVNRSTPSGGLLTIVRDATSGETVRPLGDSLTVKAPEFRDFNINVTYYIARSRSDFADSIQAAVGNAFDAFKAWQRKIGRDVNPSELTRLLGNAGAKRLTIAEPAFVSLSRDQCSRLVYESLVYGGIEDD